jgi:hypothetical protein
MLYPDWTTLWNDWKNTYWPAYAWYESSGYSWATQAGVSGFNATGWSYLVGAVHNLYVCMEFLGGAGSEPFENSFGNNLWWFAHGSTLTMGDLLNTMLGAQFDELKQFVGIEDAYRSAIWDQPFNAQFYAALAAGFRSNL